MNLTQSAYIAAGIVLPFFYVPQIRRCLVDDTGLVSYSLTKSTVQCVLRLVMMPFIHSVGNDVMLWIVWFDTVGRLAELGSALRALRRQAWTWREISLRMIPGWFIKLFGPKEPLDSNSTVLERLETLLPEVFDGELQRDPSGFVPLQANGARAAQAVPVEPRREELRAQ